MQDHKRRLERRIAATGPVADQVATTTCYMCACRCGIRVHKKDGRPIYIDGLASHPVNGGVLCAKGAAGLLNHRSPARLTTPLKRIGRRGENRFAPISWDEALTLAASWLAPIRASDPKKLAFFTGRDQSQAFTGWWAKQFGTPNYAAHGGFCSVNMAAAGLYTTGGSFWEFGEPDWQRTHYMLLFGVAEDHASNPLKIGLALLKRRGVKIVSVNPVRSGYSAIADEWLAIRPGSDGLLAMALCHQLLASGRIDLDYLARYTNASHLVICAPGASDDGLIARNPAGTPLVLDRHRQAAIACDHPQAAPALHGEAVLDDGRLARPAFELVARRCLQNRYSPEAAATETGIAAATIRRIAAEIAQAAFERGAAVEEPWTDSHGRRHARFPARPVAMHAMRGVSAHSNGFHSCRALHILQLLLGSVDAPGGWRYRPPCPRPIPAPGRPAGRAGEVVPGQPLPGMPLGFPAGPDDLLVEADGQPVRIDKAFSWQAPLAIHGLLQNVIANAWRGDPYPIDTLFLFMANMAWNSAMNTPATMAMLADRDPASGAYRIPHVIYCDAYQSETVAYADLVLPDTTYLERWDCISLLDRPIGDADAPADAIRRPVATPDRDVRPFQDVLLELGQRLRLPGMVGEDGRARYPGGYADYIVNHLRKPGIGLLAGWRGADGKAEGRGAPNPRQLEAYGANGCHWRSELAPDQRFLRFANAGYLQRAVALGLADDARPLVLRLYGEELQRFRLAARGHGAHQPPPGERERIETFFDPLPLWHPPLERPGSDYPLHAITQRPMAMYHAWGSHNAWLRQIHGHNRLYVGAAAARCAGLADGDWALVESRNGRIRVRVAIVDGVNPDTVWTWNAIGKRPGAWALPADAAEAQTGFLLNHLIDHLAPATEAGARRACADPVTGQAAWFDLTVRLVRDPCQSGQARPAFAPLAAGAAIAGPP